MGREWTLFSRSLISLAWLLLLPPHVVPSKRLLDLLAQEFCVDWLNQVERELRDLPPLSDNQRISIFVVRKTCDALSGCLDSISPTVVNHDFIEGHVRKPLEAVIVELANFRDIDNKALASLIAASEAARTGLS